MMLGVLGHGLGAPHAPLPDVLAAVDVDQLVHLVSGPASTGPGHSEVRAEQEVGQPQQKAVGQWRCRARV